MTLLRGYLANPLHLNISVGCGLTFWAFCWTLGFSRWGLWIHAHASFRSCVRLSHHIWRSTDQILMIFCTKLHLDESKNVQSRFLKKNLVCPPRGVFDPQTLFGWKMGFWAYIFETAHQILMIFSQMLDIIAFHDLALVLCTKEFSFAPPGGDLPPKIPPFS